MVAINRLSDGEYEQIGVIEDGEVVDGGERVKRVVDAFEEPPSDEELIERYDGPYLVAERTASGDEQERSLLHAEADADALTQEELVWQDVYERVLWSEDTGRSLFEFDPEDVPNFVLERLREAVQAGALFGDFETIPASAASQLGDVLLDSLEERHGWSVDSLAGNIRDVAPDVDTDDARRIARTETASLVNNAREEGYEDEFDLSEERFKWVGPDRNHTEACEWLKEQTNPDYGGTPRTLDELQDLVERAQAEFFPDLSTRKWVVHPNERHTFSRVVE